MCPVFGERSQGARERGHAGQRQRQRWQCGPLTVKGPTSTASSGARRYSSGYCSSRTYNGSSAITLSSSFTVCGTGPGAAEVRTTFPARQAWQQGSSGAVLARATTVARAHAAVGDSKTWQHSNARRPRALISFATMSPRTRSSASRLRDCGKGGAVGGTAAAAPLLTRTLAAWPTCLYALRRGTRSRLISHSRTTSLRYGA